LLYGLLSGFWLYTYNLALGHHVDVAIRRYGSVYKVVCYQMQGRANLLGFQELIRSSWRYKSSSIRTCRQLSIVSICTILFKLLSILDIRNL
jgi:hypothetical protein